MYIVVISKNEEGHVNFCELITTVTETYEEAQQFVLNIINPMIEKNFTSTEDLETHLIEMEDNNGFAPLFEIREVN